MKPSLPRVWFDLCVVPEHDTVQGSTSAAGAGRAGAANLTGNNVLITRGALNGMQPGDKQPQTGLMLIGGPSRHHGWRETELLAQVEAIVSRDRNVCWTLTTSRRTPPSTTARLARIEAANLEVVPVNATGPGWLAERLARAALAWVTEDSVSMVYEALTAGCATGILAVPARGRGKRKIQLGIEALRRDRLVTDYTSWQGGATLVPPPAPFNEAARVATWILDKWPGA
jgi:mitochondrial fission protein ELM1